MKPFRKISILSIMVFAIVMFWLVPGINKANDTEYTRIYEDTDPKPVKNKTEKPGNALAPTPDASAKKTEKRYKKESIRSKDKLRNVKATMFSRAIHFREKVPVVKEEPLTVLDSLQLSSADTLKQVQ